MDETLESIASLFNFGGSKALQPPRFARVVSVDGDAVTVTVGAENVVASRCTPCTAGDVVLLETMKGGTLAAVATKGENGGGGGTTTVRVGTTTTGEPGTDASVTNSGSDTAVVLNFTIPRGATGADGPQGPQGEPGPQGPPGQSGGGCTETTGGSTWAQTLSFTSGPGFIEQKYSDGRLVLTVWDWFSQSATTQYKTLDWSSLSTTAFSDEPLVWPSVQGNTAINNVNDAIVISVLSQNVAAKRIYFGVRRTNSTTKIAVKMRIEGHYSTASTFSITASGNAQDYGCTSVSAAAFQSGDTFATWISSGRAAGYFPGASGTWQTTSNSVFVDDDGGDAVFLYNAQGSTRVSPSDTIQAGRAYYLDY